ncbi:CDP-diacylglycerol--serine O-phosphatidyltransferase [Noviherbaspirillum sp. Root189]|uniref:CDP-diacylglycerol--serine O-phosphatidyltransferase n=1 Tax=Noviherbaspirillum sp. Root189 TaxID=1736487 RepID=UPI00070FC349|nr:CDP-diacylglycerol--serine O-phosphatidyltransferase [Noviherbaspirillum sp. Root189]KRB84581.1 CDP-diacylglycerol--serine O-phosphatidyltransferase [Noviherbaspirillum sp. Root189]
MATFNRRKAKSSAGLFPKASRFGRRASIHAAQRDGVDDDNLAVTQAPRRRGIYLLPNAFTTANLFCGFFAIVMAMNLKFDQASVAIFAAMLLDSVDGRVARLTNTQSEFGAQYDSLSDMLSFGAAPALIVYEWSLRGMGKLGWLAAFVYCAGAALRLARFNTNITVVDKRYFQGLPSPAAAALVTGFIWLMDDLRFVGTDLTWFAWTITLYAGLTMVTNVPFYSFKEINFRKSVPFIAIFVIVLIFVLISSDPPKVLFGMFVLYGLSGYVIYFWRLFKGKPVSIVDTSEHDVMDHKD